MTGSIQYQKDINTMENNEGGYVVKLLRKGVLILCNVVKKRIRSGLAHKRRTEVRD